MHKSIFNFSSKRIKVPIFRITKINGINMSINRYNFFAIANPSNSISQSINSYLIKTGFFHHLYYCFHNSFFFTAEGFNFN